MIRVKIVGDYNTGHHYERTVEIPGPTGDQCACCPPCELDDDWWNTTVYDETGDGQTDPKSVGIHTCTVLAADPPHEHLIGAECDLGG